MRIYEFGKAGAPEILLLPGTCCHWQSNFGAVIPLLESRFRVLCVSYDGFDETEDTVFPSMTEETEKIEAYIQKNCGGRIRAAYGCSLGGSFVGLLIQRKNIHIDHGILGSSDLDQAGVLAAKLQAGIAAPVLHRMLRTGKPPGWMQKRLDKKTPEDRAYLERMLKLFGVGSASMAFVKKESVYHQFYSDLITPLEKHIVIPETTVHCFYAEKMGKKYEDRYRRHFANPDIVHYDLQHEELLMRYPKEWAELVENLTLGLKRETQEEVRTP